MGHGRCLLLAAVLVLHGGGGQGMGVFTLSAHPLSVFRTVADHEGFVVIHPGDLPAVDGSPGWNDCRADNLVGSSADTRMPCGGGCVAHQRAAGGAAVRI